MCIRDRVWIKLHVSGFFDQNGKFIMYMSQIAPAEVWDPKSPVVKKTPTVEQRVVAFFEQNWKWILPGISAAAAAFWKAKDTIS